jgi:hypothetical protein
MTVSDPPTRTASMTIATGWCSQFKRLVWHQSLMHASRPPALFLQSLAKGLALANMTQIASLVTDENLGEVDVSQEALAAISACDIAYLSSHGRRAGTGYRFRLHGGEWAVPGSLGNPGPAVLVLDTCDLIDPGGSFQGSDWLRAGRATPAVVLGFVGAATDGFRSALRGEAFARNLALGSTFADAWIDAVRSTNASGRDRPIAVAFGPTMADAAATLNNASLTMMPAPTVADHCYWMVG